MVVNLGACELRWRGVEGGGLGLLKEERGKEGRQKERILSGNPTLLIAFIVYAGRGREQRRSSSSMTMSSDPRSPSRWSSVARCELRCRQSVRGYPYRVSYILIDVTV